MALANKPTLSSRKKLARFLLMTEYDLWLEEPYQILCDDPDPIGIAVQADAGIFNWMNFALNNEQRNIHDLTWDTLIDGPFPSVWLKIRFALCYLRCLLACLFRPSDDLPLAAFSKDFFFVVSERCALFADPEYYAAAFEVGEQWRGRFCGNLVSARESDSNFSIEYYPVQEDLSDL